jgi:predicted nucleic acid-binding protein
VKYLLDVNVLVAWGWADHVEHERTVAWIASGKTEGHGFLTSAIPELGFVRVSVQRAGGHISVTEAGAVLSGMLASLGRLHNFLPDNMHSRNLPEWCASATRTTDAHLLQLAKAHQAQLATLDTGIPGAFLIPFIAALT